MAAVFVPDRVSVQDADGVVVSPASEGTLASALWALARALAALMSPAWVDRSLNRARETAIIESGTVTTVSTVTSLGTMPAQMEPVMQNQAAWALCVRSRLS